MRAIDKCWIGAAAVLAAGDSSEISNEAAAVLEITRPLLAALSDKNRAMVLLVETLLFGNELAQKEEQANEKAMANQNHVAVGRKKVLPHARSMDAQRRRR